MKYKGSVVSVTDSTKITVKLILIVSVATGKTHESVFTISPGHAKDLADKLSSAADGCFGSSPPTPSEDE